MKKLIQFCVVSLIFQCELSHPDELEEEALYERILAMDTALFNAFNNRDLETTKEIFDPDLEFFHDVGGVSDYEQAIENTRQLFEANTGLRRELIVESVGVHPIADYGAIQVGKHRFCHPENGKMDCGVFDFLHVWKENNNTWTLALVVSHGH